MTYTELSRYFTTTWLVLLLLFLTAASVTSSPVHRQEIRVSLYNASDHLTILNSDNFYNTLLGKPHAWLVQFYSSYCGHCIAFSPIFKEFVKNIADWGHTIQPAVLNCALEENTGFCRMYNVMGYPTLAFLPLNAAKDDQGVQLDASARTSPTMRAAIIDYLAVQEAAGNSTQSWTNVLPFSGSVEELFSTVGPNVLEGVVFVDSADSYMAREALMGIGYYNELVVSRWMVNNTGFLQHLPQPPSSLPAVVLLSRHTAEPRLMPDAITSTQQLVTAAINMLTLEPEILPSYRIHMDDAAVVEEGAGDGTNGDILGEELNSDKLNYDDNLPDTYYDPDASKTDQVFLVDVENAITYALKQEVGLHNSLSGERLQALKQFLNVVVKYLPSRPKVHAFLSDLAKSVAKFEDTVSHDEYSDALARASQHGLFPEQQDWVGCKGSEPHLRGFPCGLWTTFHLLTVNAVITERDNPQANAKETVNAIHAFVKYFLSCTHCSEHFQEMFAEDAESYVKAPKDSIIWMWKAHNKVNKRLSGDATEDPKHPKVQYPPRTLCPKCWRDDNPANPFKEQEVLAYLKKVYAKGAISLQNIIRHGKSSQGAKAPQENSGMRRTGKNINVGSSLDHKDLVVDEVGGQGFKSDQTSSIFSSLTNISNCMLLYSATTIVVAAIYFGILIRKRIRRKRFIEMCKNPINVASHTDITPLRDLPKHC